MPNSSHPCIAETFKAGDKLAGCYTLKELLPEHGFCVVWLANDEELNKDVVLHFIPDSVMADSQAISELKDAAKRNRQLIHPRIVRVHDLIEDEKWAAISMDYIPGETYAALEKKHAGGALNPSELAAGITDLCQTLEDAHRIDLFHRDLAPENLLSTTSGLMVLKFIISRVILDSLARGGKPIPGARDIAYIGPQQLGGERPTRADDLYSMGAMLFELLTGAPPFTEGDIVPQIQKTVPPLVSQRRAAQGITGEDVPKAWEDAIAACLAKNADERPKTAADASTRFAAGAVAPAAAAEIPAAVAAAAVVAAVETPKEPAPPEPPVEEARPATSPPPPDQEAVAKPPKRSAGPGRTPLITEATVISKTDLPKPEPKPEPKAEPPQEPAFAEAAASSGPKKPLAAGPTTPSGFPLGAFVEVDGDKKPQKGKSPAGLIVVVVLVAIIVVAYLLVPKNNTPSQSSDNVAASGTSSSAYSETTPPEAPVESPAPSAPPVNLAENSPTPTPEETPAVAEQTPTPEATPAAESTPAESAAPMPAPSIAAIPASAFASMTDAQAQALVAEKSKAVQDAQAALAAAEKDAQDKAAAQTQAASVAQDLQTSIKQKADAATAAKQAADAAAASLKQQQASLQQAQADADAAAKLAAAKAQAAAELSTTVQAAQADAAAKLAAQQQAEADAAQITTTAADRQQAAQAAAQAAADAEKTRQQQAQALSDAQAELAQVQAGVAQAQTAEKEQEAAQEAARVEQEREAETARLNAQAQAAAKAAADAQKALEAAQKAVADAEKAQAEAEREAEAARNGVLPVPAASPAAAPSATPPAGAAASPAAGGVAPTLSVHALTPNQSVIEALSNSLGMRFAPVGKIYFSIWLTRVQDFQAFAQATGYKGTVWEDPGFKQGPDHPVVNVSWDDANQFCLWLTEKEHHAGILPAGYTYRLPTDIEWSYAVGLPLESGRTPEARDMDVADVYPWGTQWPPPPGAGNYTGEETDSDVAIKGYDDGFAWTSPVGSFTANKFGLYDMGGNVWEWCEDWWNSDQDARVLRGASWNNGALKLSLLSSCRYHGAADEETDNYGFRVVIAPEVTHRRHVAGSASPAGQ